MTEDGERQASVSAGDGRKRRRRRAVLVGVYLALAFVDAVLHWGWFEAVGMVVLGTAVAAGSLRLNERRQRRTLEQTGRTILTVVDVHVAGLREFAAIWRGLAALFLIAAGVVLAVRVVDGALAFFGGGDPPAPRGEASAMFFLVVMIFMWFVATVRWVTPELRVGEQGLLLFNRSLTPDQFFAWGQLGDSYFWKPAGSRWNLYLQIAQTDPEEGAQWLALDLPPLGGERQEELDRVLQTHMRRLPPPSERSSGKG